MQKNIVKVVAIIFAIIFIFVSGTGFGYIMSGMYGGATLGHTLRSFIADNQPNEAEKADFALYWEVWHRVESQFYDGVPADPIATYGAIKGSLATLNDPYTIFIEPEPAAKEKATLEGQFGGIGAFVRQDEGGRIVLEPMRGQPAEQSGLETDDILVGVDTIPITVTMTIDAVIAMIRGEVGTKVTLTVERKSEPEPVDIIIERAVIQTPSANWRIIEEEPTIGYIRLSSFTERSNEEITQAFNELSADGAKSYIFDLRSNGGGLLDAAVDIASQFFQDGIVLREDRKNEGERVYDVKKSGKILDEPVVLLVDGGTASASEIVAGALQDRKRAVLIGEKTFGKGSVQLIYELPDKSRLHVTVAKWFTPNGTAINGIGLTPDIETLFTEEDRTAGRDVQFERAINFLQNGE